MHYFSLSPHIYAARFGNSIIILDSANDDYISLIDDSAYFLTKIIEEKIIFNQETKTYICPNEDSQQLTEWINQLLELNIIQQTDRPGKAIASAPIKPGGLHDYQWDTKPSWKPFKQANKYQVLKTFAQLAKVHRLLKRQGIKGVLNAIQETPNENLIIPSALQIQDLANLVDAASLFYPKKTFCLAWAATFVILARKKNWDSQLVIGVQAHPFYAHAWAQIDGKVIHDDPVIAQVLSLILHSPQG
ncbi:MAG: hypothetical protein AMXMBFR12_07110 [Candidatus Babeliales bacterium]